MLRESCREAKGDFEGYEEEIRKDAKGEFKIEIPPCQCAGAKQLK